MTAVEPSRAALACVVLLLSLAACDSPSAPETPQPLALTRITQPAFSGFDTPQRLVIRSQPAWEAAWATLWARAGQSPALPPVDFTRDVVLLAAAGARPTSGYFIAIEAASATGDAATVTVRSYAPGAGCEILPVVTTPVDVVSMPRRDRVTFVEESQVRPCGSPP